MKTYYWLPVLLLLSACNPFEVRQAEARKAMADAEAKAQQINRKYEPDIRQIKPYEVYSYQSVLTDPFRVRQFIVQEEETTMVPITPKVPVVRCTPPSCVPPKPHLKSLLENYGLDALRFVGTLGTDSGVALVRTPDFGVVSVKVGDYMGRNNGLVLEIKESAIILQEKLQKNGLWEDKKTVLVIQ